ncbi:hypothetical protein ADL05_14470 [Nocardiopsis sp. NRRL B-16309]|nr:hypothetical protein ADL05_14470 [Nocardiopsis sp. NRRL B-16309]
MRTGLGANAQAWSDVLTRVEPGALPLGQRWAEFGSSDTPEGIAHPRRIPPPHRAGALDAGTTGSAPTAPSTT